MKNYLRWFTSSLILSLLGAFSCFRETPYTYELPVGGTPVNLEFFNTSADDYNSALPYPATREDFMFSSNRNSKVFNIIYQKMDISYHEEDNLFDIVYVPLDYYAGESIHVNRISSKFDELGPYFYRDDSKEYFFYASNDSGNFDIKYLYTSFANPIFSDLAKGPINAAVLNTESDDYYPSINNQTNELYFCSNRDGDVFDIYSMQPPNNQDLVSSLQFQENPSITLNLDFSSNADDKCPFYFDNYLVFTSNRDGGYGGYDLWYAKYDGSKWSSPKNCGEKINSEADEYRPILIDLSRKLMIFSSNRSGGKGGFDLYAVRVDF